MSNIYPTGINQNQFQQTDQFNQGTGLQQGLQPGPLPHTGVQNSNTVPLGAGQSAGIPHSNMSRDAIPQRTTFNAAGEPVRDRTMGEKFDSATHSMHNKLAKNGGGDVDLLKRQNEEKRELDKAHHRALHGRGVKEASGVGDLVGQIGDKFSEGGTKIKHKIQEARTKMGNKEVACDQHGNAVPVDKNSGINNNTAFTGNNSSLGSTGMGSTGMGNSTLGSTGMGSTGLGSQQGFQGGDPLLEKQRMAGQVGGAPLDVNRARG
jgi:hypothetical protein